MIIIVKGAPALEDAIAFLDMLLEAYPDAMLTMPQPEEGHEIVIPDGARRHHKYQGPG